MPQPTASDVHVNRPLTNISVAYIQQASHFIHGSVFPRVPVAKQSDRYYEYTKADWFRSEAEVRADGTESAGSGFRITSTSNYFCDVIAMHKDVGDQARANSDEGIALDRDATQFISQNMMQKAEADWVTTYFSTGVWGTTSTPSNLWDAYATSDPIDDFEAGKETILQNTGFLANTLVLGYQVARVLKHHPDVVDRVKYTGGPGSDPLAAIADLVGVDRVLVAMAVQNTAAEGAAESMSFHHGKHALLCYVNPNPGLLAPSAGYNFTWSGVSGGLGTDIAVSSFRMDELKADRIEAEMAYDYKVIASDLGYFYSAAIS